MNTESTLNLLDEDGENRAVRMFLALYGGTYSVTAERMREHLEMAGYPYWPKWAESNDHLTKGGAQDWLRHLFALEAQPVSAGLTNEQLVDLVPVTATILEGEPRKVCMTRAELLQFARALLSAAQQSSQPVADTSADARDAARYRWLREQGGKSWTELLTQTRLVGVFYDCAVDAAIAASREV